MPNGDPITSLPPARAVREQHTQAPAGLSQGRGHPLAICLKAQTNSKSCQHITAACNKTSLCHVQGLQRPLALQQKVPDIP